MILVKGQGQFLHHTHPVQIPRHHRPTLNVLCTLKNDGRYSVNIHRRKVTLAECPLDLQKVGKAPPEEVAAYERHEEGYVEEDVSGDCDGAEEVPCAEREAVNWGEEHPHLRHCQKERC